MPTFKGVLAFDPADAIPLGMIPKFEPIRQEDEPRGFYTTNEDSGTYEAYTGRRFPVTTFIYTSNSFDLEEAETDPSTNILSKKFNFTLEFVWYRNEFFEVSTIRSSISIIAVGRDQDKKANTDSVFYVNANRSEEISIQFRPRFPVVSDQQAQSILGYYVDISLSPSARRLLPANVLRLRSIASGSVRGSDLDFSGTTIDQVLANVDISSDPAFYAAGITFLPFLKTGFQVANASTVFNTEVVISKEDIDNAIVFNDCIGVAVSLGVGVGDVVCVTRDPLEAPGYQKRRVGYGVTIPWGGYWLGGIDGQYVVEARPLHYALQFESAVDDLFMGALNAPVLRYGGATDNDLYYNCPRFSYTRIKNNFVIVYIPKAEAVEGFSFYISAHVCEDSSLYAMRVDSIMIINQVGVNRGSGSFVFSPKSYHVNSNIFIKNWIKKRTITSSLLGSDPLTDIPAFSSSVVSEYAKPLKFTDAAIADRSLQGSTDSPVSLANTMRLVKTRVQSKLPRLERFPLGYFAAADFFATNFDGDERVSGGIAYIDKNGNVDILLPKEQIRDKQWFDSYFKGFTLNPIVEQEYYLNTGNDGGYVYLFYDVSPICNSLYGDNSKIPYDHRLAKALSDASIFSSSNAESGIGICQLNFLLKRSTGAWTVREDAMLKSPPSLEQEDLIGYYYDLSGAQFDLATPMPSPLQMEIRNPTVGLRTQGGYIPAQITAFIEWSVLAPVSLKSNGRIYFQTTEPVSYATGGSNSELNVPYVLTNPTSGKISTCIDFHGLNGAIISSGSFGGSELRSIHINGTIENQKRKLLVDDMSFPVGDVRSDWYDKSRPCWYGFAVDDLPLKVRGSMVFRQQNPKGSSVTDPPITSLIQNVSSKLSSRSINYYQYINGKWVSLQREEKSASFSLPDSQLVQKLKVTIKGKTKEEIPAFKSFVNISFGSSISGSPINSDAIIYNDAVINNYESGKEVSIVAECLVDYYGGKITVFGGAMDSLESGEAFAEVVTADSSSVSSYKIDATDAAVAMLSDGRYVAVASVVKQGASTLDMFVKSNDRGAWRRIPNIVQPFSGESFGSVMVRSDKYNNKIYVSYTVNECLFIKPVDPDWMDYASDQGVVSVPSRFALPDKSVYGMSGKVYGEIFSVNDVRTAYLENKIRIKPSYLVYGNNNQFLDFERQSTQNAYRNRTNIDSGDGIEPRMEIGTEYASADNKIKSLYAQSPSESYSFEVLPDGSLFMISIKDGGVIMRRSGNSGRSWKSSFIDFREGVSCRPVKFLKSDVGSSVNKNGDQFTYVNGSCPQIESVSTAIDIYGQKVAIAYSIRGMIFLQEVPVSIIMEDCIEYLRKVFTTDQREINTKNDGVYPVFIGGSIPTEYVDALIEGKCDFAWKMAGALSRENISAVGNISMGSKSPAMIYLSNGTLRMHFEGDRGEIRAISINASTVRGDYLP